MKPVFINFTDENGEKTKTFTTCTMKTGIVDNIFDIAERVEKLEKGNVTMSEVRAFYNDLKSLILEVFKYQFSFEDLNECVEQEELMKVFKDICNSIGSGMKKN